MEGKETRPAYETAVSIPATEVELELGRAAGNASPLLVRKERKSAFSFRDISFTVKIKKETKTLLRNVSGVVESGHVLAIMGPSGAGKTTLINALTLNGFGGETRGVVQLDGQDLTAEMMRARGFVVAQQDNHWPFLTCRETLAFAADFYLDAPANERKLAVETIIKKMGLVSCADTTVGNEFVEGLSGGQKRRLSIGIALIKQPDMIFLDEPTSGLDAAAAANIMTFIKELAQAENLIIIATIHQPSAKVYEGFDQVMIMSKGRMAFQGDAAHAMDYFAGIGHHVPAHTNQADHFLDLVNSDFTDDKSVVGILDSWDSSKESKDLPSDVPATAASSEPLHQYRTSFSTQISVMMRRQFLIAMRDPLLFLGRAVMIFIANLYFAIIYIEARNRDQDQVINKFWLNVWYICVPANMGVVAVYAYNAEFKAVRREVRNGMVSPIAYLCANALMQIPLLFLFGFFALGIPAYAVSNYWGPNFGLMLLVFSVSLYTYECFAQLFSVLNDNPLLGMMNFVSVWFNGFLFGGFLIPLDDIVWPFRAFVYFFPLRYCVRAMSYVEYIDTTFQECSADTSGTDTCDSSEICFGRTEETGRQDGGDVLNSLGEIFNITSDDNTLVEDILVNLGVAIFLKICHMMVLSSLVKKASPVLPPTEK